MQALGYWGVLFQGSFGGMVGAGACAGLGCQGAVCKGCFVRMAETGAWIAVGVLGYAVLDQLGGMAGLGTGWGCPGVLRVTFKRWLDLL